MERGDVKPIILLILTLIAMCQGLIAPACADGIIIIDPPFGVDVRLDQALAIKYHHVDVNIKDQVATTRVDQVFINDNTWDAEGTYIFPLPEGAAVSDFVMWVDGKPVRGEILEADQARAIYNDIVQRMKDPALLEYAGRKALKASIFPIPPGGERRIELEYSQVLPVDKGLVHYVYPLSTEKFSARPLQELVIKVDVESKEALKAVYSPSHDVSVDRRDDYHAVLGLEESSVLPDRDFELYYTISPEKVGLNLLSYKEKDQDGFFLLLAAPNVQINESEIVAKDVILVLDTSGSMDGEKLEQAKQAARYILKHLHDEDRFGLVSFSTTTKAFRSELAPASQAGQGEDFVARLEAMGSTDINRALVEALDLADKERPTTLIFLTDGLATEGVQDTQAILSNVQDAAPKNVRIFSFGVGDDVDTDLLDLLSLDHGGTSAYVRPGQKIDEEVSAFYSKVSTPVLSNVQIDLGDISTDQLYPEKLPDLFAGSQLVLVGRYKEGGPAKITLSGIVNGKPKSFVYPDSYFRKEGGENFVPRLWATRAIGYYLTQIRLRGEKQEWIDTIVSLSTRYGIITPYTSFLIQEEDIFTASGRQKAVEVFQGEVAKEAAAPSYGAPAAEKAAFESALRAAPVAGAPVENFTMTSETGATEEVRVKDVVKYVGSKTFMLRNETWIDTVYQGQETQKVVFLSGEYFDLVSRAPELGAYLALGNRVIVVYQGVSYEIVMDEKAASSAKASAAGA